MHNSMNRKKVLFYSFVFIVVFLLFIKAKHSILFMTNDDVGMRNFVSGSYNGNLDAHLIYMQYPLGLLFKILYQINTSMPWYGLFQLAIISLFIYLYCVFLLHKCQQNRMRFFAFISLFCIVYIIVAPITVQLQFTTTAAVSAATGILLFMQNMNHNKKYSLLIFSALFMVICFMIRKQVFYIGMAYLLIIVAFYYRYEFKKMIKYFSIILIGIVLTICINTFAYQSEGWSTYLNYNKNRSLLMDYYGIPPYEENKQFYTDNHISKEEVALLENYCFILSDNLTMDKIEKISTYAKEHSVQWSQSFNQLINVIKKLPRTLFSSDYKPYYFVIIGMMLILLVNSKWTRRDLFICISTIMLHALLLAYLLYMGRFPQRIGISLYLLDITFISSAIIVRPFSLSIKTLYATAINIVLCVCLIAQLQMAYYSLQDRINQISCMNQDYQKLIDYCREHIDKIYFYDVYSVAKYTDAMLSPNEGKYMNYISFGGWSSYTPLYNDKLKQKQIDNVTNALVGENIYIVVDAQKNINYITNFYNRINMYVEPIIVDIIDGELTTFHIIQLQKK